MILLIRPAMPDSGGCGQTGKHKVEKLSAQPVELISVQTEALRPHGHAQSSRQLATVRHHCGAQFRSGGDVRQLLRQTLRARGKIETENSGRRDAHPHRSARG
jgi:hypothetical protein